MEPTTPNRVPGRRIRRLVLGNLPGPTAVLLGVLTLLVVTQDLLGFSDLVLNRGLPASVIGGITLDRAIPSIAWMIPFATLLGGLVALGRLASEGELFLLQTSGISLLSLWRPFVVFGVVMAALCALLSLGAAPLSNQRLDARLDELARTHPWSHLQAGFVHRFGDYRLSAREITPDGKELRSVQLYMPDLGDTVFAELARLEASENGRIQIVLENMRSLPRPEEGEPSGRALDAARMVTTLPSSDEQLARTEVDRLAGLSLSRLRERGDPESLLALHRRFSWPVLTLLFAAGTIPLFVRGARFSRSTGLVVGIVVLALYQGLIQIGNGLVWSETVPAAVGAWLPVALVGAGVLLLPFGLHTRPTFGPRPEPSRFGVWLAARRGSNARRGGRHALDRYVARSFFEMFLLCFLGILVAYVAIDVLERVDRFVRYAPSLSEIGRYYLARLPLLASRVVPIALLVGTAVTVALVGSRGELVGMRACGIPAWRGLLPILVISAVAVPSSFLLNDRVIPHSTALADRINDLIKGRPTGALREGTWFREGNRFYEAALFDPEAGIAREITVYELDESGLPLRRIDATSARHVGDGMWSLVDGQHVDAGGETARIQPTDPVTRLGGDVNLQLDTRHLSVSQVQEEIGLLEANGVDATRFHVDFWAKLATPLACLLLPMLALFFALGGPPHPSTAASLVFSVAIAVSYTLLTGLGASFGYGGALPPPAAAFAPALLFTAIALALGRRLHLFR
ncbi:MAG: LptF/LptG family permease [Myxococcota bacterium]|nr:LptF/LptG family permease [Myxococcota bacterium]